MPTGDTRRPRVAVLGSGSWGSNHVRVWHELGCLRVVADVDPSRLADVGTRYPDVELETSAAAALARPDVDAVVIATPAITHAALALDAVAAGKDVLVEKPLAVRVTEAEQVLREAQRKARILQVGHVLEYHPAVRKLQELVWTGALGQVRYLYSNRLNFGRFRTEESALWSFAPHDLALALRILAATPEDISCRGGSYLSPGVADTTLMTLSFPGGVKGHIFVSWLHPFKEHRFVVVGDRQMAVFDDGAPWAEKLVVYPHTVEWRGGRVPLARKADAFNVALEPAEPLREECEEFVRCIMNREEPLTGGHSALRVLRVLDAAERSLERGGDVIGVGASPEDLVPPSVFVHPTAVVDPGARLGDGCKVWHFTHVMPGAEVGPGTSLGQSVYVGATARIGRSVKVQNNVSVYDGVVLEDDVFCGPSVVFTNVLHPRAEIERKDEYHPTIVRRGTSLGANSTVLCGLTIGEYSLVGAGAVVTRDVPPHAIVTGVPARVTGWVCRCGRKLNFDGASGSCSDCGRHYQRLGQDAVSLATT